jgi:hypothetical protein
MRITDPRSVLKVRSSAFAKYVAHEAAFLVKELKYEVGFPAKEKKIAGTY